MFAGRAIKLKQPQLYVSYLASYPTYGITLGSERDSRRLLHALRFALQAPGPAAITSPEERLAIVDDAFVVLSLLGFAKLNPLDEQSFTQALSIALTEGSEASVARAHALLKELKAAVDVRGASVEASETIVATARSAIEAQRADSTLRSVIAALESAEGLDSEVAWLKGLKEKSAAALL